MLRSTILPAAFLLVISNASLYSQVYINKEFVQSDGQPQNIPWTATALDGERNLIVVGNTEVSPGDHDVLILKYDANGELLWQKTYGGNAGGNDYGVAVFAGEYGEIVVAAVVLDTVGAQNVALLQYDEDGVLIWDEKWNGPGDLADVPADLAIAYGDQIFVCGATWASDGLTTDYFLLSYDWNGNYQWESTYDHAGLIDAATQVQLIDSEVIVTGGSASALNEWDYATVVYDASIGEELDIIRVQLPGVGLDNALAMFMDETGNTYITGYRENSGQKDIQTIKIANDLTLDWVEDFDLGDDDIGNAIGADINGNVYVAGSTGDGAGGSYFTVIMYDSTGQQLWYEQYQPTGNTHIGVATKLVILEDGVVVTGYVSDGTSLNYVLVKYGSDSREHWRKEHDNGFGDDKALALAADAEGSFYVSGITETANGPQYTTVKYNVYVKDSPIVTDSLGNPMYADEQVIIRFFPWVVDTNFVDDREQQHILLSKLVPDTVAAAIMAGLGQPPGDAEHVRVLKIHKRFTRADSISIARSGEQFRLPKFWNSFVMMVDKDVLEACDSLRTLTDIVKFVHPSILFQPYSNDPLYESGDQSSLVDGNYINAHINVEPAWQIQVGGPQVRVGIIDTPVKWDHPDYMFDGVSRVVAAREYWNGGDWNFDTNEPYQLNNDGYHGTACAGIIGAVRNNEEGVAGIAGGDAAEGMPGVELVSLMVGYGTTYQTLEVISAAMMDAVLQTTVGNGLGCDVVNMSVGAPATFIPANLPALMVEALEVGFANQCVFVGAHGNHVLGGSNFSSWPTALPAFGHVHDHAILSVGATGDLQNQGGLGYGTWLRHPYGPTNLMSNYGSGIDLVAPGSHRMIVAPRDWVAPYGCEFDDFEFPDYTCIGGTSAAAPHVAGVAALMCSHHHPINGAANGLSPEDVEILLENSATSLPDDPYLPTSDAGYDPYHGHGRVDAGLVLEWVSDPYCVLHFQNTDTGLPSSGTQLQSIQIPQNNPLDLEPDLYDAYLGTITLFYQHEFDPGAEVLDAWIRPSLLRGTHNSLFADGKPWGHLDYVINGNMVDITITTHVWKLISPDIFYPMDPFEVFTPYSIHVKDEPCWSASTVAISEKEPMNSIHLYPNPANDLLYVELAGLKTGQGSIRIFDPLGSLVIEQKLSAGQRQIQVPIEMLARGPYILMLDQGAERKALQFIKL